MNAEEYAEKRVKVHKKVREGNNFLIVTHAGPDFDTISSGLAWALYLIRLGKNVTVYNERGNIFESKFGFLPYSNCMVSSISDISSFDAVFILDNGAISRVGRIAEDLKGAKYLINIDHHEDNDLFGNLNIIDDQASSTCELIFGLMEERFINLDIANCLYTGINSDTGSFNYKVSSRTFFVCSKLLSYGVDVEWIKECMNTPIDRDKIDLWGMIYTKREHYKSLALVYLDPETIAGLNFEPEEIKINIHSRLRSIDGVKITVQIQAIKIDPENPKNNQFRLSLRSKGGIAVNKFTHRYPGGGGHPLAAGCDVFGKTLEEVKQDLYKFADQNL
ncbi:hypothetical protein A2531_04390 [Candidatus Falkowbacteria bacterium RIFOXYD2_FULL_34_120]|uniref:Uncharacterized protein n=1 Tax=Candidatus Falkowbacteria bacterium RIFOXYD2_FULL_34_120 TaxID=1798007 RepID=A0A1F5TQ54_9BACT|nr:MAG: hypothetical protein A2466_01340 [Candidatus Falkowbacteria bacterium RIFOXYC2_FULL_34_220]OGF38660.1 MAG: hypothetical protein A2515_04925 [Candidatus Falkowbacteria bacterium RIFOXYD12_FULL_34_57]OGF40977.1 MAG: hypothetical protein A2531_04390 [Candidatus Falkowbacteria bacterium RIFOXYD2_FULL_34_120]